MSTASRNRRGPGQPKKPLRERREPFNIRISAREMAIIRRLAKEHGLPVSTYIRQRALGET